jgi:hypothetical protein
MGIRHCTARWDWLKDQSPLSSPCCVVGGWAELVQAKRLSVGGAVRFRNYLCNVACVELAMLSRPYRARTVSADSPA